VKEFAQNFSRIEPLNLIEVAASVVMRSVAAIPFGAFRFGIARLKDWFRSSAHVLFGDAAGAVFPLGRLVLRMTTGRRATGDSNKTANSLSHESLACARF